MSSAGNEVTDPAPDGSRAGPALTVIDGGAGAASSAPRPRNRLATASVIAGACGFSLLSIGPALGLGGLGRRRSARGRAGAARCWLGIGAALAWAALGGYLLPNLARAADPGCTAYKGPVLAAYGKVIADFNAAGPRASLGHDLTVTVGRLRAAAAQSRSPATARALTRLAADLAAVRSGIRARTGVPQRALSALNRAATRADQACGTLRL